MLARLTLFSSSNEATRGGAAAAGGAGAGADEADALAVLVNAAADSPAPAPAEAATGSPRSGLIGTAAASCFCCTTRENYLEIESKSITKGERKRKKPFFFVELLVKFFIFFSKRPQNPSLSANLRRPSRRRRRSRSSSGLARDEPGESLADVQEAATAAATAAAAAAATAATSSSAPAHPPEHVRNLLAAREPLLYRDGRRPPRRRQRGSQGRREAI